MAEELSRNEPLDTDIGPEGLSAVALVAVGGTLGTAARYLLDSAIPDAFGLPAGIFFINLSGAFLLGWLMESLALRGPDIGHRRSLRLLVGAGVLGGYTTYSALAGDTASLILDGHTFAAFVYALSTVVFGGAASWVGVVTGKMIGAAR